MLFYQAPAVVVALLTWLSAPMPTLADAAARETFRRAVTAPSTRALTNADLPDVPLPSEAVAGTEAPPADVTLPSQGTAPAQAAPANRDELLANARDALVRNQLLAQAMQARVDALTNDLANQIDRTQRATMTEDRQRALAGLNALLTEIEENERMITALENPAVPLPAAREPLPGASDLSSTDEEGWRKLMADARATLARDRLLADAVQTRINQLTNDFVSRDDPAQRATIAQDRLRAIDELEHLQQVIAEDDLAIKQIREDARRKGVPPGWVR